MEEVSARNNNIRDVRSTLARCFLGERELAVSHLEMLFNSACYDEWTREEARAALVTTGWQPTRLEDRVLVAIENAKPLEFSDEEREVGGQFLMRLVERYQGFGSFLGERKKMELLLSALGTLRFPPATEMLKSLALRTEVHRRDLVIDALCECSSNGGFAELDELLVRGDWSVRREVYYKWGRLATPEAAERLRRVVAAPRDEADREAAQRELAKLESRPVSE